MRFRFLLPLAALTLSMPAHAQSTSSFSYSAVQPGTSLPLSLTVNNIKATFSGNGAVCSSAGIANNLFVAFNGNALMQGFCNNSVAGPLTITFSRAIKVINFNVAINGLTPQPVTVSFAYRGNVVNTQTITTVIPDNSQSPEGKVLFGGIFDTVTVSSTGLLAVGNLSVVPTPALSVGPTH